VMTGATARVGPALARALVARGARVLLVARTATSLAALARELVHDDDHRHRVDALTADVTNANARLAVRDASIARGVNVLINAASINGTGPLQALDPARADAVLQTNLVAPVQLSRALLPHLLRQPQARIVNIGRPAVPADGANAAVHQASQAGLRQFCDALRRELADTGVRVQFLAPTAVDADACVDSAHDVLRKLLAGTSDRLFGFSSASVTRMAHWLR
jgi:short-subunit dehydrogenase